MILEDPRLFEIQADLIAMFANPKRLMILDLLSESELSVGEIAQRLDLPIQNVSQHLRGMRDRGVVVARKAGQAVYYTLSNPKFAQACKLVRAAIAEETAKRGELLELRGKPGRQFAARTRP